MTCNYCGYAPMKWDSTNAQNDIFKCPRCNAEIKLSQSFWDFHISWTKGVVGK